MTKGVNLPELLVTTLFNSITSFCSAMIMTEEPNCKGTNVSDRRSNDKRNKMTSETSISSTTRNLKKRSPKTNEINQQATEELKDSTIEKTRK